MTFACLSQATALSKRVFHQTQNTFNRIQNTFITDEIHDQGKNYHFRSEISREASLPADFFVVSFIHENRVCDSSKIQCDQNMMASQMKNSH